MIDKWDLRYLGLAEYWANICSKDPSTKVGAVIVDRRNAIVSLGYNGFPIGVKDSDERLNNRELKYKMVVHAEVNAMHFAERSLYGCTLYTWPFMPCSVCAGQVIQREIKRVVAPYSDNPRWIEAFELTRQMFDEAHVVLEEVGKPSILLGTREVDDVTPKRYGGHLGTCNALFGSFCDCGKKE